MQRNFRAITLIAIALISGCGQVDGTAQPATELFDPCLVVPDEAIRAAGADPATKDSQSGPDTQHWAYCTWSSDWYFMDIQSTTRTMTELASNPTYLDVRGGIVDERDSAIVFHVGQNVESTRNCVVAFPWSRGSIAVLVDTKLSVTALRDPCEVAISASNSFSQFLPK